MNSPYYAHETAIIDVGADIGTGTKIWHFCHVMKGATIGNNCILGQNVFVAGGVRIGNGVKIQNNVSLYTGVVIEDDVFLGPSMVFTNVLQPRAFIERKSEFLTTLVEKGASIGANATIICGAKIGAYAMVGAGAVIRKDVPAFALVVGNPARQIGWVSRSGRRLFFEENAPATPSEAGQIAICTETGEHYRLFDGKIEIIR